MMAESSPTIDESVVHPIESGGETAVYVRNACKSFGVGKRRATVLRNLDMNVKKGTMQKSSKYSTFNFPLFMQNVFVIRETW